MPIGREAPCGLSGRFRVRCARRWGSGEGEASAVELGPDRTYWETGQSKASFSPKRRNLESNHTRLLGEMPS